MNLDRIIEGFRKGDYSGFDEFYRETSRSVYFTALGILGDPSAAEEIMQDTYVAFIEAAEGFRIGESVSAYLSKIARNMCLNRIKKERRVTYNDELLAAMPAEERELDGVSEILALLPSAEDRELVTYHVLLGYKFREIAAITGKPMGTLLWRYNKAIRHLRERVGDIL